MNKETQFLWKILNVVQIIIETENKIKLNNIK